jgi:hypothetical protein
MRSLYLIHVHQASLARAISTIWPALRRQNTHQDARLIARRLRFNSHLTFSPTPTKDQRATAIPAALARAIHPKQETAR